MSVTLDPEVEDRIKPWLDSGRFPNASAVVLEALELLEERDRTQFLKLREMVRAGFESGDEVDLTPELWDQLLREADEDYERGEQPAP